MASVEEVFKIGESPVVSLLNHNGNMIEDYFEVFTALEDVGSYQKNLKKLDIDL